MNVLVIGRGEIGEPLFKLISQHFPTETYDIVDEAQPQKTYDVIHICYPYIPETFEESALKYIERFTPSLTIIESTVPPGTTRKVCERTSKKVCHSPVLGRATDGFEWALKTYTKFVGALDRNVAQEAQTHFESMGLKTQFAGKPENTEWAKLLETSYWGLLVTFYQDVERISNTFDLDTKQILDFFDTVQKGGKVPRPVLYVGSLGGHCIISNAKMLLKEYDSNFVADIVRSQLTFEATMQSIFNLGEQAGCVLCGRVYSRKIYRNVSSEPFFIVQCLTCREPMVVMRSHSPLRQHLNQAVETAKTLFPDFNVNLLMRGIPEHPHFHMRKET